MDKEKRIYTLPVILGERLSRYTALGMIFLQYLMVVYLVYTRTRGAWIGALGALLIVGATILLYPGLRRPFLMALRPNLNRAKRLLLWGAVAIFALLAFLPPRFRDTGLQRFDEKKADVVSTVVSIATGYGERGRWKMWGNTWDLICDHPLLGVGPGGWKRAYPPYDRGAMISPRSSPKTTHNPFIAKPLQPTHQSVIPSTRSLRTRA